MLKKIKLFSVLIAAGALMSGCATVKTPLSGAWYTDVKAPFAVTGNSNATKVGMAEASSILGIVATGDASIDAAAKKAGITRITHVDEHSTSIMGFYAKYRVYVYGE